MADNVPEPVFRAFLALDWADKNMRSLSRTP